MANAILNFHFDYVTTSLTSHANMPPCHQTGKLACACSVCSMKEIHVKYKVNQPLTKQAKVVYCETLMKRIQASQSSCAVKKIHVKDYAIAHLPASEEVW